VRWHPDATRSTLKILIAAGITLTGSEIKPQDSRSAKVMLIAHGAGDLLSTAIGAGGHGLLFVNDGASAIDIASTR